MTSLKRLLMASALAVTAAGSASAETYRFSMWNGPSEPTVIANQKFVDEIGPATSGDISFEFFTGGAIMLPKGHLQGIGDGVVQAGQVTVGYTPSDLPVNASIGGFGFIESDPIAIGAAYADWIMHDPVALAEWKGHNVIPIAGFSTPEYSLICNTSEPVTTIEQMEGLKVRSYGLIGALVKDLGGTPVAIPASEAYQALQTGALDCASLSANWLRDGNLDEVSKWTTLTRWTPAFNSPQMAVNIDFWKSLTNEQRAAFLKLAARTEARAHILYDAAATGGIDEAKAKGHTIHEPGASLQKAVDDWIAAGVGNAKGIARDTYGVADPDAVFTSFEPYVKKWGELVRGMKNRIDEEELTSLLLDNMFNDIDPASYGMD